MVDVPDPAHRVVTGSELHPDVRELAAGNPSLYTREYLLRSFNGRAEEVWTAESVAGVNRWLLGWWLAAWAFLLFVLSTFVALQWHSPARSPPGPRGPKNPRAGNAKSQTRDD